MTSVFLGRARLPSQRVGAKRAARGGACYEDRGSVGLKGTETVPPGPPATRPLAGKAVRRAGSRLRKLVVERPLAPADSPARTRKGRGWTRRETASTHPGAATGLFQRYNPIRSTFYGARALRVSGFALDRRHDCHAVLSLRPEIVPSSE